MCCRTFSSRRRSFRMISESRAISPQGGKADRCSACSGLIVLQNISGVGVALIGGGGQQSDCRLVVLLYLLTVEIHLPKLVLGVLILLLRCLP